MNGTFGQRPDVQINVLEIGIQRAQVLDGLCGIRNKAEQEGDVRQSGFTAGHVTCSEVAGWNSNATGIRVGARGAEQGRR